VALSLRKGRRRGSLTRSSISVSRNTCKKRFGVPHSHIEEPRERRVCHAVRVLGEGSGDKGGKVTAGVDLF
jgi:hypothetical protein